MDQTTATYAINKVKEYTDSQKLAYEGTERIACAFGKTVVTEVNEDYGGIAVAIIDGTLSLKESDVGVDVIWAADLYRYETRYDSGAFHLGNAALAGEGFDSGEPFLIIVDFDQSMTLVITKDAGTHTITTYAFREYVRQIDAKFIPNHMPMVTAYAHSGDGWYSLGVDSSTILSSQAEKAMPVFAFVNTSKGKGCGVATALDIGEGVVATAYELPLPSYGLTVRFEKKGKDWGAFAIETTT